MATISDFKSRLAFGGARPNQFTVSLMFPAFIQNGVFASSQSQFLCKATSLPGSSIEDITINYRGRPVHFAGERSFAPWRVTIYNEATLVLEMRLKIGIIQLSIMDQQMAPQCQSTIKLI